MALLLTAPQCFFITILAFGLLGFVRGWRREVISLGFVLAGVLFLYLNGGYNLAQFLFVRLPIAIQDMFGGPGSAKAQSAPPSAFMIFATTLLTFVVIVAAGYLISNRAVPAKQSAATPADRFLGIVPGVITGYALINYITSTFSKAPIITVGINTPNQNLIGNYMLVIFVVVVVAVVAGLIASSVKKGGAPKK
ncbi:MAG TPA: CvpA family protein [Ktedonobacteraceae bacterium]|jgi:uncharacterized membrane protein required for colicin V production|nr:CvpA family protein [Ktedonobacteraceae bacterium]